MINDEVIFNCLVELFPSNFKAKFSAQELTSTNTFSVYFKGGTPKGRIITNGKYGVRSKLVVLNIQGENSLSGNRGALKFAQECFDTLERLAGYVYTDSETGGKLVLLSADIIGDINQLGLNTFNVPSLSLNFILNYAIGGVNHG